MEVEKVQVLLHRSGYDSWKGTGPPGTRLEQIPEGTKPLKLIFGWGTQEVPKQKTAGR